MKHTSAGHTHSTVRPHSAGVYRIRLKGHLEPRWADWFDGMSLTIQSDGTTVLEGAVVDQAALHGLLAKLRDVGLPLLSVTEVEPGPLTACANPLAPSSEPPTPSTNPHAASQGD